MKKTILNYLLITIITLFVFSSVSADIGINYSDSDNQLKASKTLTGKSDDNPPHTAYKVSTDGKIVYCGDATKGMPSLSEGTVIWDQCTQHTANKKELTYIFEKGYGGSNSSSNYLASNKKDSYFIAQMAVWAFTNPNHEWITSLNSITSPDSLESKMQQLIKDAKNAKAEIKITSPSSKEMTNDGNYYTTEAITIGGSNVENLTITLSGAEGAFATKSKDGKTADTNFSLGDKIYIKIPANKVADEANVKLTVNGKTFLGNGTIEECIFTGNSDVQALLQYKRGLGSITAATDTYTAKVNKIDVVISKTDIAGSKEIEGAHLVVKDKNGNTVTDGEWISETNPKTLSLTPGTYTLTETIAPEGFIKSSETIKFIIDEDGKVKVDGKEVQSVVMKNKPITVYISKRSIRGKDELPGAKLKITNKANDKVVKDLDGKELEWISTTKEQSFHLPAGTYILTESIAPKGYEVSDTKLEFTVTEDGKVLIDKKEQEKNLIIFTNTPEAEIVPTGSAYIYITIILGIISIGICGYAIYNNKKKAE